jgi:hypothetical protein
MRGGTKRVRDEKQIGQRKRGGSGGVPKQPAPPFMVKPQQCNYINEKGECCTKEARDKDKDRCSLHPACTAPNCTKLVMRAQGGTPCCIAHGGGKRCEEAGCLKSAQGGTARCKAHGGGKRCEEAGCSKSARGATARCVAHGGGKRCEEAGCSKSAQGGTARCKAHDPTRAAARAQKKKATAQRAQEKAAEKKAAAAARAAEKKAAAAAQNARLPAPRGKKVLAKEVAKEQRKIARARLEKLEENLFEKAEAAGAGPFELEILRLRPAFEANTIRRGKIWPAWRNTEPVDFYTARAEASRLSTWLNAPKPPIPDTFIFK